MTLLKVSQPQGDPCINRGAQYVQVDGCDDPDQIVVDIALNAGQAIADPQVFLPNVFVQHQGDGLFKISADKAGSYLIEFFCGDCFDPPPPPLG